MSDIEQYDREDWSLWARSTTAQRASANGKPGRVGRRPESLVGTLAFGSEQMTTPPRDTSPEIWRMQREIVTAMTPEARLQAAFEVSEVVRELQIKGLLLRNPTWDRSEAIRRLVLDSTGIDIRRPA